MNSNKTRERTERNRDFADTFLSTVSEYFFGNHVKSVSEFFKPSQTCRL